MKLYEIDQAIENLIDDETGEILDLDAFMDLQMAREKKVENIALWYKNMTAEADAIKTEIKNLAEREKAIRGKADSLKQRLAAILQGEKFETAKVSVSYRKSAAVEVSDNFIEWAKANADHLLKYKEPEPDKTAIKQALSNGDDVTGATIIERVNIQVK